jgi:hypothetical protein
MHDVIRMEEREKTEGKLVNSFLPCEILISFLGKQGYGFLTVHFPRKKRWRI